MKKVAKFEREEFGISDEQKSLIIGGAIEKTFDNRTIEGTKYEGNKSYQDYSYDNGSTQKCDVLMDTLTPNNPGTFQDGWIPVDFG